MLEIESPIAGSTAPSTTTASSADLNQEAALPAVVVLGSAEPAVGGVVVLEAVESAVVLGSAEPAVVVHEAVESAVVLGSAEPVLGAVEPTMGACVSSTHKKPAVVALRTASVEPAVVLGAAGPVLGAVEPAMGASVSSIYKKPAVVALRTLTYFQLLICKRSASFWRKSNHDKNIVAICTTAFETISFQCSICRGRATVAQFSISPHTHTHTHSSSSFFFFCF